MCQSKNHFEPVRCIIPPYISNVLMTNSDSEIAARAVNSQLQTSTLRASRKFIGSLAKDQKRALIPAAKSKTATMQMQVYDIKHSTDVGGAILLWENGHAKKKLDEDAKNVVAAGTATWDFYYKIFGRNSVDNLGMMLKHYVHYGNTADDMDNAMWDGMEMVYGDGDGKVFGSFTTDADIVGHELTHGVTQYASNLDYHNQSGALNESLSDVFGIMIKQRMNSQDVKKANWLIGENVLLGNKYALRSMKEPGKAYVNHPDLGTDPQPATMNHFLKMSDNSAGDWGGVHYNSGIPNFAFYVTAFNMGGFAWEKAGKIWYEAMTDTKNFKHNADFAKFKALTIAKAEALFGINSNEAKAVKKRLGSSKSLNMKIKLLRSGGFIPINKMAETEVDWTDADIDKIVSAAGVSAAGTSRDGVGYTLEVGERSVSIDLTRMPAAYRVVFDGLVSGLKIVKQ